MRHALLEQFFDGICVVVLVVLCASIPVPEIVGRVTEEGLWDELGASWPAFVVTIVGLCMVSGMWRTYRAMQRPQEHLDVKSVPHHLLFFLFICVLVFPVRLVSEYGPMHVTMLVLSASIAAASLALTSIKMSLHKNRVSLLDSGLPFIWSLITLFVSAHIPEIALIVLMMGSVVYLWELDAVFIRTMMPYVKMKKSVIGK